MQNAKEYEQMLENKKRQIAKTQFKLKRRTLLSDLNNHDQKSLSQVRNFYFHWWTIMQGVFKEISKESLTLNHIKCCSQKNKYPIFSRDKSITMSLLKCKKVF